MDIRRTSSDIAEIAERVIDSVEDLQWLKTPDFTILYLESEAAKKSQGHLVYAQCEKVQQKNKWAVPADFTITVFSPNVETFTERQMEILIEHELRHIGVKENGSLYVVPHDIGEFTLIAEKYGVSWAAESQF